MHYPETDILRLGQIQELFCLREFVVSSDPSLPLARQFHAFNCLTRKQLSAVLLQSCQERLRSASASLAQAASQPQPNGWNHLWKFIASHYACHGLLKFFHSGTVTDINSESGVTAGRSARQHPICSGHPTRPPGPRQIVPVPAHYRLR